MERTPVFGNMDLLQFLIAGDTSLVDMLSLKTLFMDMDMFFDRNNVIFLYDIVHHDLVST